MDPAYETVVDPATMVFTLAAYLVHGGFALFQVVLAGLMGAEAVRSFRVGAVYPGAVHLAVSAALLLPLLTGAPVGVAMAGSAFAFWLLLHAPRGWRRTLATPLAALLTVFMIWEREDPLRLGVDLATTMQAVRNEEVTWQRAADLQAPKVGDLAPDFSLEDPTGTERMRLSEHRGKRPVALLFGSYT